jgi:hypothetical protein
MLWRAYMRLVMFLLWPIYRRWMLPKFSSHSTQRLFRDTKQFRHLLTTQDLSEEHERETVADYWPDEAAHACLHRFALDCSDVLALLKIDALRREGGNLLFAGPSPRKTFVLGVAAVGVIGSLVPRETFTTVGIGSSYGPFRGIAALIVLLSALYAAILSGLFGSAIAQRKRADRQLTVVLTYCSIVCKAANDQVAGQGPIRQEGGPETEPRP